MPSAPDILILLVLAIPVWLSIRATLKAINTFEGAALPLWILVSWLFPIIGPIVCFYVAKKQSDLH